MNVPNALTLSRLAAIPLLMILLIVRFDGHDQLAAALFVTFSFTDTLDGQIARRRGTVSDLGKFLDPLADKLFVLSVLIVLVQEGLVAAWVVVVIFSRELLITILRSVAAKGSIPISGSPISFENASVRWQTRLPLLERHQQNIRGFAIFRGCVQRATAAAAGS